MVKDPKLAEHLLHFGIDINAMKKVLYLQKLPPVFLKMMAIDTTNID